MSRGLSLLALWLLVPSLALAHRASDSYLTLEQTGSQLTGTWDIHLRDLDYLLLLDADGDGLLRWGELAGREQAVVAQALRGLALSVSGVPCELQAGAVGIVAHSDGSYLRLPLAASCERAGQLSLHYSLLAHEDPSHRAVVRVSKGKSTLASFVLGAHNTDVLLPAPGELRVRRLLAQAAGFVWQGGAHVLSGADHVLFLLVLLLPAVLRRDPGAWQPAAELRGVLVEVFKIVTAFTLAHSLTLSLASLGLVSVASWLIEPAIAASVTLAAANNLRPVLAEGRWSMAFALGLLHGFGFSSALLDAGLDSQTLLPALLGFNLGVELAQLALVALFVPCAFLVRGTRAYRRVGLGLGSLAVLMVSLVWLYQRVQVG